MNSISHHATRKKTEKNRLVRSLVRRITMKEIHSRNIPKSNHRHCLRFSIVSPQSNFILRSFHPFVTLDQHHFNDISDKSVSAYLSIIILKNISQLVKYHWNINISTKSHLFQFWPQSIFEIFSIRVQVNFDIVFSKFIVSTFIHYFSDFLLIPSSPPRESKMKFVIMKATFLQFSSFSEHRGMQFPNFVPMRLSH